MYLLCHMTRLIWVEAAFINIEKTKYPAVAAQLTDQKKVKKKKKTKPENYLTSARFKKL